MFIIFGPQKLKIKFKQVCMHLKTHFKVLFYSSKISKTCAHIIFLLNTRTYQELNKIGTITFGSTKLELHIFESIHKSCEKQLNKTKKRKPNSTAGPTRRSRRPTTHAGAAQMRCGPRRLPPMLGD